MERVVANTVELVWDAETRIATIRANGAPVVASRAEAVVLVDALQRLTEPPDRRWALLVDCTRIRSVDPGWRSTWFAFAKEERHRVAVACHSAEASLRVVISMFFTANRLLGTFSGEIFPGEAEARSWLRSQGFTP